MTRAPLLLGTALALGLAGCGQKPTDNATATASDNGLGAANVAPAAPVPGNAAAAVDVSNWATLDAALGKYPADLKLFEQGVLVAPLKSLLGDDFDDFVENMGVAGPLSRDGVLYVTGNKPHEGGSDAAYLLIDPKTEKLAVGLWEDGKFKSFTSPGALLTRPKDVKTMIANFRADTKPD
ncbi:MAG: hypothetical protein ACREB5_12775 [Sphingomonadaceae bacterium]